MTRAEGEFAALGAGEAASRIDAGIALFDRLGWPLAGFVPPAWLMSDGTRAAIEARVHRFSYVSVRAGIYRLPEWRFVRTANLCYSPTSVARRAYSRLAIARDLERAHAGMLLRITLHPQDAREPSVMRHWERVIRQVAATRQLTTKRDWIAELRQPTARVPLQRRGEPCALESAPASSEPAAPPATS
jgi:predicted deacetylase